MEEEELKWEMLSSASCKYMSAKENMRITLQECEFILGKDNSHFIPLGFSYSIKYLFAIAYYNLINLRLHSFKK